MAESIVSERIKRAVGGIRRLDIWARTTYRWEGLFIHTDRRVFDKDHPLDAAACDKQCREYCKHLTIPALRPIIVTETDLPAGALAIADYYRRQIKIRPEMAQPSVLMHEVAHMVSPIPWHDRNWRRRYVGLLVEFGELDRGYLWGQAYRLGLR